jgi:hypothetical protein
VAIAYNPSIVTNDLVLSLDAKNPKSYSPNVHPKPLDIYGWWSSGNAATFSRDYTTGVSPAGGVPLLMAVTGIDPYISTYNTPIAPAVSGQTWTVSVWVKASVATTVELYLFGINSANTYVEVNGGGINITTSWTRISRTYTLTNINSVYIGTRLDGPGTGGTGVNVWWDGLQVEKSSSATTFNPITNTNGTALFDGAKAANSSIISTSVDTSFNSSGYITYPGVTGYTDCSVPSIANSAVITVELLARVSSISSVMPFGFGSYDAYFVTTGFGFNTAASDLYGISPATVTSLGLLNNWKHYILVMNRTTSYTNNKMYINSVAQSLSQQSGTENAGNRTFSSGTGNLRIAGWLGGTNYRIPMDLAVFRIYNKELSVSEINQNYNALCGRFNL